MRRLLSITLLILFSGAAFSQQAQPQPGGESTGDMLLYRNEVNGGVLIHANGIGAFARKGKHVTGKLKRFYEADIVTMKHPKEIKTTNPYVENAKGYIYGKLNAVTILRAGIGFQNKISGKDRRRGVEVRSHYFAGPSLGIAKPIYLDILYNDKRILLSEKFDATKHHIDNIYGKSSFTKGLDEIRPYPGLYGKAGLSFEYSGYDDKVKAIETGITLDAYTRKIPMMALSKGNQYFLSFYISLVFGKKSF